MHICRGPPRRYRAVSGRVLLRRWNWFSLDIFNLAILVILLLGFNITSLSALLNHPLQSSKDRIPIFIRVLLFERQYHGRQLLRTFLRAATIRLWRPNLFTERRWSICPCAPYTRQSRIGLVIYALLHQREVSLKDITFFLRARQSRHLTEPTELH